MTTIDDFVDDFGLLGDWDQRYQYLIELGEQLPEMPVALKIEENRVKACMSKVWVSAYTEPNDKDEIYYLGDSDSSIIKGVLALLIELASGNKPEKIIRIDMDELFKRLELDEHLSPNRHVGVYAIVELIKQQARLIAENNLKVA